MSNIKLKDEDGKEVEVTPEVLLKLLRETFGIAVANTIEHIYGGREPNRNLRRINAVLNKTWNNEKWAEKFVNRIYDFAMKEDGNE